MPEEPPMRSRTTAYFAAFLVTTACAGMASGAAGPVSAATAESKEVVQQAIDNAAIAVKKTAGVGYLWIDTEKLLKEAQDAVSKGDNAAAVKLADQARFQAEAGYEQYLQQRNAKPPF
jgi:opacity protein-like surface antigen